MLTVTSVIMVIMLTIFRSRREERDNNREAAYIQAITAAAVTHTLTRNCSQGSIPVSGGYHDNL